MSDDDEQVVDDAELNAILEKAKKDAHRLQVLSEMIATEHTYVSNLKMVVEQLANFLRMEGEIPEEQIDQIFGNISEIYSLASKMLDALQDCVNVAAEGSKLEIGALFQRFLPMLAPAYIRYCENYFANVQNNIKNWVKLLEGRLKVLHKTFSEWSEVGGLPSLLIMPVQRMPRYVLLINEFIKDTADDNSELTQLKAALECGKRVLTEINESVRVAENKTKVQEIHKALSTSKPYRLLKGATIVQTGALLLKNGEMEVRFTTSKQRRVFLFSDRILFADADSNHFKGIMYLKTCWIVDSFSVENIAVETDLTRTFWLISPNDEANAPVFLRCIAKTEWECLEWTKAVEEAINQHAFSPKSDKALLEERTATCTILNPKLVIHIAPTKCRAVPKESAMQASASSASAAISSTAGSSVNQIIANEPEEDMFGRGSDEEKEADADADAGMSPSYAGSRNNSSFRHSGTGNDWESLLNTQNNASSNVSNLFEEALNSNDATSTTANLSFSTAGLTTLSSTEESLFHDADAEIFGQVSKNSRKLSSAIAAGSANTSAAIAAASSSSASTLVSASQQQQQPSMIVKTKAKDGLFDLEEDDKLLEEMDALLGPSKKDESTPRTASVSSTTVLGSSNAVKKKNTSLFDGVEDDDGDWLSKAKK